MDCSVCGRKLKSARSQALGYGPVCYRKIFGSSPRSAGKDMVSETTDIPYYDIPGQMTMEEYLQTIENG